MMDPMWYFIERSFQTIAHFILWSFLLSMKYCSLFCSSFLMIFELNVHWRGHLKKCLVFFSRTNNSSCSNTFKCVYVSEAGTKPLDTFVSYFLNEHLNNLHWFLHDVEKKEQKRCQFVFFSIRKLHFINKYNGKMMAPLSNLPRNHAKRKSVEKSRKHLKMPNQLQCIKMFKLQSN